MHDKEKILSKYLSDSLSVTERSAGIPAQQSPRGAGSSHGSPKGPRSPSRAGSQRGPPSVASQNSKMWRGPSSEAGYSYPETAVTSRAAGSITESELHLFMSKISQLESEMQREKERGKMLETHLRHLEQTVGQSTAAGTPKNSTQSHRQATSSAGATAGVASNTGQQRAAVQHIKQAARTGTAKAAGGWGYATIDTVKTLKPAAPKPRK